MAELMVRIGTIYTFDRGGLQFYEADAILDDGFVTRVNFSWEELQEALKISREEEVTLVISDEDPTKRHIKEIREATKNT